MRTRHPFGTRTVLALALALAFAGCNKSQPTETAQPAAQGSGGQPADTTAAADASAAQDSGSTTGAAGAEAGTDAGAASDGGGAVAEGTTSDAGAGAAEDAGTRATATGDGGAGDLAAAEGIYNRACGRCHPHGNAGDGPRVRNRRWAEARMRTQIRQGGGDMPPIRVSRLSDADLDTMMAFLRSIQAVR